MAKLSLPDWAWAGWGRKPDPNDRTRCRLGIPPDHGYAWWYCPKCGICTQFSVHYGEKIARDYQSVYQDKTAVFKYCVVCPKDEAGRRVCMFIVQPGAVPPDLTA